MAFAITRRAIFLRDQVALDDEVLLYHSHCKQIGIVGTARVVKTAYPDPTQFDPESDYYDPKSSHDAPRWFSVDINLQEKFSRTILLAEIKQHPLLPGFAAYHIGIQTPEAILIEEGQMEDEDGDDAGIEPVAEELQSSETTKPQDSLEDE